MLSDFEPSGINNDLIVAAKGFRPVVMLKDSWGGNNEDMADVAIGRIDALRNDTDITYITPTVPNSTSVLLNSTENTDFMNSVNNPSWLKDFNMHGTIATIIVMSLRYLVVPYILLLITSLLWERYCVSLRDKTSELPLPGGRMGLPVVGEMFQFLLEGVNFQKRRKWEFGPIYRTHLFGRPTITVIGDKYVKGILLGEGHLVEAKWPNTTRIILGTDGIVNGSKETHTRIKRLALRAFSPRFMKTYAPSVMKSIKNHVAQWKRKGEIHILEECRQLVARTMLTVLMGVNEEDPDIQKYISAADDIINSILCIPVETPFSALRRGKRARGFIFDQMEMKLKAKMESTDEELFDCPGFDASSAHARGTNMDEFVANGRRQDSVFVNIIKLARLEGEKNIKLRNLQNLSLEFIFAGTQSLQSSSSMMIMHLSQHPKVLELLRQEIKHHGLWDVPLEEIEYKQINSLSYTSHVVSEVLRVTPPIPGAIRVAKKTFELGGYQVPKGWQVLYSIRGTHIMAAGEEKLSSKPYLDFDPSYFACDKCNRTRGQQPEVTSKLSPLTSEEFHHGDRLDKQHDEKQNETSEKSDKVHICCHKNGPFSFIPFGKGARMCAGVNYALFVLRVLAVEIARSSDFELVNKAKIIQIPMTKPAPSVRVLFKPIT